MAGMNLLETHKKLSAWFERQGVDAPRFASEIIISRTLDIPRVNIYANFERVMVDSELDQIRGRGKRLVAGEPIQLIVGDCQFLSHIFKVESGVFIPRPETEQLALVAAEFFSSNSAAAPFNTLLDLCCGTGVISVSLLKSFPEMRAVGVDISETATRLAEVNSSSLGVADRAEFLLGDLFSPLPPDSIFDAILSNPPYIPSGDIPSLDSVVKNHDPLAALDGGPDGLDIVRRIAEAAPDRLRSGGFIALEIGAGQAAPVIDILLNSGFNNCDARKDLNGIERIVTAWAK